MRFPHLRLSLLTIIPAAFLLCLTACHDDDDDNLRDHQPPAGQGSIIIDNNTFNDIHVFFNGVAQAQAPDRKARAYDLDPGVYRVVLDEERGSRSFRGDVDVLENRRTIIDVGSSGSFTRYDVFIFFD